MSIIYVSIPKSLDNFREILETSLEKIGHSVLPRGGSLDEIASQLKQADYVLHCISRSDTGHFSLGHAIGVVGKDKVITFNWVPSTSTYMQLAQRLDTLGHYEKWEHAVKALR